VRALRSLWKPEPEAFEGKYFRWAPLYSNPKPVQRGGVPIVVGGHTPLSAKRAARYGNGYFPGRGTPETLAPLLATMRAECERTGRAANEIEVSAAGYTVDLDTVRRLRDLGVHRIVTLPPGFDPKGVDDGLARFAEQVIAKL
jgi:alkanesulfonate monooxygenase SsuD/methylene tetrahydromethanopterin reductase-like flavin-dependent oxidoreductase (luciferase family)